jgi:hypothetical protein
MVSLRRRSVALAVDPFLLRSALHSGLAADPRLEVLLCPSSDDPLEFAHRMGAQVLLTSKPVKVADVRVVVLDSAGVTLTLAVGDGRRHLSDDAGSSPVARLADELAGVELATAS